MLNHAPREKVHKLREAQQTAAQKESGHAADVNYVYKVARPIQFGDARASGERVNIWRRTTKS